MSRMPADEPRLTGATEIGRMLGISRQRVQQLAAEPGFPEPAAVLAMGKVWREGDVIAWAKASGRLAES